MALYVIITDSDYSWLGIFGLITGNRLVYAGGTNDVIMRMVQVAWILDVNFFLSMSMSYMSALLD